MPPQYDCDDGSLFQDDSPEYVALQTLAPSCASLLNSFKVGPQKGSLARAGPPEGPPQSWKPPTQDPNQRGSGFVTPPRTVRSNNTPSPVLTTEQLYKCAKWMDRDPELDDGSDDLDDLRPKRVEEKIRNQLFPSPRLPDPFGDSSPAKKLNFSEQALQRVELPTSLPTESQLNRLEEIPTSMAEIYQLSNKNRKEKKKKVKSEHLSSSDEKKEGKAVKEDFEQATKDDYDTSIQFMKKIGWLKEQQEIPAQRPPRTNNNSNQLKKPSNAGTKPYPNHKGGRGGGQRGNYVQRGYGGHQEGRQNQYHQGHQGYYPPSYGGHQSQYSNNYYMHQNHYPLNPSDGLPFYQH